MSKYSICCYLKIAVNEEFHWLRKIELWRRWVELTPVSVLFSLFPTWSSACVAHSGDSQITSLLHFFLHQNVKVAETFNQLLPPDADEVCYKSQARVLQDLQEFWGELSLTDCSFFKSHFLTLHSKHIYYRANKTYINAVAFQLINDAPDRLPN